MEQLAQIEESIKALWEKAKQAGEIIVRLRDEKQTLQTQNTLLQQEIAKLRGELSSKEQQSKATAIISNGERELLTAKVKELLARIDAYL